MRFNTRDMLSFVYIINKLPLPKDLTYMILLHRSDLTPCCICGDYTVRPATNCSSKHCVFLKQHFKNTHILDTQTNKLKRKFHILSHQSLKAFEYTMVAFNPNNSYYLWNYMEPITLLTRNITSTLIKCFICGKKRPNRIKSLPNTHNKLSVLNLNDIDKIYCAVALCVNCRL